MCNNGHTIGLQGEGRDSMFEKHELIVNLIEIKFRIRDTKNSKREIIYSKAAHTGKTQPLSASQHTQ